jgi:hypothetical protein
MSPSKTRPAAPAWGRLPALAVALVCVLVVPAAAQPKKGGKATPPPPAGDRAAPTSNTGPASVTGEPAGADKPDPKDGKDTKDLKKGKDGKPKTFDFNALDLNGRMRSPQLLYFLERANEELERASLEKRSFIPHMVRSLEEEQL